MKPACRHHSTHQGRASSRSSLLWLEPSLPSQEPWAPFWLHAGNHMGPGNCKPWGERRQVSGQQWHRQPFPHRRNFNIKKKNLGRKFCRNSSLFFTRTDHDSALDSCNSQLPPHIHTRKRQLEGGRIWEQRCQWSGQSPTKVWPGHLKSAVQTARLMTRNPSFQSFGQCVGATLEDEAAVPNAHPWYPHHLLQGTKEKSYAVRAPWNRAAPWVKNEEVNPAQETGTHAHPQESMSLWTLPAEYGLDLKTLFW